MLDRLRLEPDELPRCLELRMTRGRANAIGVWVAMITLLLALPIALIEWPFVIPVRIYKKAPTPPPRTPWRVVTVTGPYRIGGDIFAPVLISRRESKIGPQARGIVILEVIVDTKGRVSAPKVLRGISPDLDSVATKTVLEWRYQPATLRGKPAPVYLVVAVPSG
jgi:hypothetical protein